MKSKAQIEKMYDDINLKRDNVLPEDILEMIEELQRLRKLFVSVWPYVRCDNSQKAPKRYRDCVKAINKIVLDERDLMGDKQ
tara:strand:+ start:227 stop:472 length:246 start_codon:yes stop_codon:yes gene_type:complete